MIRDINRVLIAIAEYNDLDIEEAIQLQKRSAIGILAGDSIKNSFSLQVSLITTINIASRVFGHVYCQIAKDIPNLTSLPGETLNEIIISYECILSEDKCKLSETKLLFDIECFDENCIEIISSGWRGGISLYQQPRINIPGTESSIPLGAIASASIGCFWAFCKVYNLKGFDLAVSTGISLWNLNSGEEWFKAENDGPIYLNLPKNIWSLGLGHLGQAYLWTLSLTPFLEPQKIMFLLQDDDICNIENLGSQVLSRKSDINFPKTRACMKFLEGIGFKTRIIEKKFITSDCDQELIEKFPFLVNGVDNIKTRKALDRDKIKLYLDGATNGSSSLFDSFTMRNVSRINKTHPIWQETNTQTEILHKNLFKRFEQKEKCGVLSNIGVSTPFIGLFGSAIIVSELLRSLNKGRCYSTVSLQLRDLSVIEAIENGFYGNELQRFAVL